MNNSLTRRDFLEKGALAAGALAGYGLAAQAGVGTARPPSPALPWYARTFRWGQTNITELDPDRYDVNWWRHYWKRTETQGVIINAGGIVAYYPSRVPLHRPAAHLAGRDLFGELSRAAREEGLIVMARMDSNRAHEELYRAHPDWFAIDGSGRPHMTGELFVTCVNSPYYEEHIPAILREIIERYHPDGFTDNSWSGLGRNSPCFCENCRSRFRAIAGQALPSEKNWDDPVYRHWIRWNYERRLELWDLNNRVTKAAGGATCIWAGMNSGSLSGQCQTFRDYRSICRRADILMLDHQSRSDTGGFQQNGEIGKLLHGMLGWEKLIPESMALYQAGRPTFRLASKPEPEARLWMFDGIAGGIQPWWHHVGAYHEDRRMYQTVEPVYRWHKAHQDFLVNRRPVATVGVVWSQENADFYGRDDAETLVELPWRGLTQALIRARIPYLPVHIDDLDDQATKCSALVLADLGAMSDGQAAAVKRFVQRGGGLLATGQTSLFDEWGNPRRDYALADLFGAHALRPRPENSDASRRKSASQTAHTYLRLTPELRAKLDGPHIKDEPEVKGERHPVLAGFEQTDIIPFGGMLEPLDVDPSSEVLLTFVPQFPIYPPETAWMREPKTHIPGLILNTTVNGSRVAFLPADLDRRFGRDNLPDHGDLLRNLVCWAGKADLPLVVTGAGLIDCHLYRQAGRMILHLVNLTNAATWRQPVHEIIPVGPLEVQIRLAEDVKGKNVRLLVSDKRISAHSSKGWCHFKLDSLRDHEVIVLT